MTKTIRHSREYLEAFQEGQQVIVRPIATFLFGINGSCLRQHLFLDSEIGVEIDLRRFY